MKKSMMSLILMGTLGLLLSSVMAADLPGADPQALWTYITQESPYQTWAFWPDHQGMQPGRAPHGVQHKVFVNDRALKSTGPPLQYGAIQVKENYNDTGKLMAITVMYKVAGFNPGDGDWFWVKYTPAGEAQPFGKPAGCIGCHGTRADNDFVLVHDFR